MEWRIGEGEEYRARPDQEPVASWKDQPAPVAHTDTACPSRADR